MGTYQYATGLTLILALFWTAAPKGAQVATPPAAQPAAANQAPAFFNGGYGFNADGLASLQRILADASAVDVNIYCHEWRAAILQRGAKMKLRKPSEPNPFVVPGEFETLTRFRIAEARQSIQNAGNRQPPAGR